MTGNARELCERKGVKPHTTIPNHSHSASKGVAGRAIGVQLESFVAFKIYLKAIQAETGGKSFTANLRQSPQYLIVRCTAPEGNVSGTFHLNFT